ncbi:MAG: chemotaxis protein CheW [Spirochaetes bacterium]|nr:chemotaxis protein CheW [Spirochaetota bacterium]
METNRVTKSANDGKLVKDEDIISIETSTDSAQSSDVAQLVSFLIDETEYAVDILVVNEILRYPEITRLPNTPKFIRGVINLRGNVIPVVDVRLRFGFSKGSITDLTRIIVVDTGGKQIGLLVDNVYQVVRIPTANIDPPSEIITGVSEEFISGIGRFNDRLIILLKMSYLIFLEDKVGAKEVSSLNSDNQ